MAKKLILIKALYDGGKSENIEAALTASGLPFKSYVFGEDELPHYEISAAPCVIVDVGGKIDKPIHEYRENYDHAALVAHWNAAANELPKPQAKPIAKIITKDSLGVERSLFSVNENITIRVEIWLPDMSAVYEEFAGAFPVPFFGAGGQEFFIKLVFIAGVAETTVLADRFAPGKYRATKASSDLADVIEHEIIVAL